MYKKDYLYKIYQITGAADLEIAEEVLDEMARVGIDLDALDDDSPEYSNIIMDSSVAILLKTSRSEFGPYDEITRDEYWKQSDSSMYTNTITRM
jgi:hypothetical protein